MQIYNSTTSPSFSAMRIKPEAKSALMNTTKEKLETISKVGEELKDTKFWHMSIDKDLTPTIEDAYIPRYTGYFEVEQEKINKDFFSLHTISAISNDKISKGDKYKAAYKMSSAVEVEDLVKKINNAKTTIEKAAEIVKALEKNAIRKDAEEKANAEISSMVNDLLSKFGV